MQLKRLAGVGGLVFVGLIVVVNLMQGAAGRPFGDSSDEGYRADYLELYSQEQWLSTVLGLVLPFIWLGLAVFAVGMAVTLIQAGRGAEGGALALLGVIGVTMQNSIFPAVVALDLAQFRLVEETGALELGLLEVHAALFEINSISLAIALTGFGAALAFTRASGPWLPRIALTGALLLAISMASVGFDAAGGLFDVIGLIGFVLWLAFIAGASAWLLRDGGRPA